MANGSARLQELKNRLSPAVFAEVEAQLGGDNLTAADNQNQNGLTAEIANLKPDVLREIAFGGLLQSEAADNNQNQNGAELDELLKMKPDVLRQIRVALTVTEAADNQNQNGSGALRVAEEAKPALSD